MDERLEGGVSGPVKSYSPIDVDAALVCLVSGVVPILERGDWTRSRVGLDFLELILFIDRQISPGEFDLSRV